MKGRNRSLLFISIVVILLPISIICIYNAASASAKEITVQQRGQIILTDVLGIDLSKYTLTIQQYNEEPFLGIVPQSNIQYNLQSSTNNFEMLCTFTNGSLQLMHVLENGGSSMLTATADVLHLSKAKSFLRSYQSYSGDSFYGILESMLNTVDASKNSSVITGNTQLDVTPSGTSTTFRWTYVSNGIQAPVKCVALSYTDGVLKYFVDNWNLYTIGDTHIELSENEAINNGFASAKSFSWSIGSGDSIFEVRDFNVTQAMVWDTVFANSLSVESARSHNPFILYPIRHVWVSLDKYYPGNVYGIEVFYWADTKNLFYMHERSSNLDPIGDSELDAFDSPAATQFSSVNAISSSSTVIPTLAIIGLTVSALWFMKRRNAVQLKVVKICCFFICILVSSCALLLPISSAYAINRNVLIWGSRSSGAYDPVLHATWRKTSGELAKQSSLAQNIANMFSAYGGYSGVHNYQGVNSGKYNILQNISSSRVNYPFTAVVDFDHGVGNNYPSSYFHYQFEDDTGNWIGSHDSGHWQISNGVYDYLVYGYSGGSQYQSEVYFAFISTCQSASITTQGVQPDGLRVGMPYAWTHRTPLWKYTQGFSTQYHMSLFGYSQPDGGSYCYIGFPIGSPGLDQTGVQYGYNNTPYASFVAEIFAYALMYHYSVRGALDQAALACFTRKFSETNLYTGFTAIWPMYWGGSWHNQSGTPNADTMAVYGNGDMLLS